MKGHADRSRGMKDEQPGDDENQSGQSNLRVRGEQEEQHVERTLVFVFNPGRGKPGSV